MDEIILSPHLTEPKSIDATLDVKYGTAHRARMCIGIVTPYGT